MVSLCCSVYSLLMYFLQVDSTDMVSTASVMKQSQLDVKLQSLMDLICDIKAMEECVLQMKFDTKKAPLG